MAREKNKALGHHGIHMSRLLPPQGINSRPAFSQEP